MDIRGSSSIQSFSEDDSLKTELQWRRRRGVELLPHIPESADWLLVGAILGFEMSLLRHSVGKSGCLAEGSLDNVRKSSLILRPAAFLGPFNFEPRRSRRMARLSVRAGQERVVSGGNIPCVFGFICPACWGSGWEAARWATSAT
jgi:hypothetical protein